MTNKEALIAVLRVNIPDNSLVKALLDNDVSDSGTYTKTDEQSIDLCAIDLLAGLLSEADVSEGGYSIKNDRAAVLKQILFLARKHNVTDIIQQYSPTITSKAVW
jgi:hypothetical protein